MKSTKTNNLKRVCNFLGVPRPMFVDPTAKGYKGKFGIGTGQAIAQRYDSLEQLEEAIFAGTGVKVKAKNAKISYYDTLSLIIPYSGEDDTEVLNYNYR